MASNIAGLLGLTMSGFFLVLALSCLVMLVSNLLPRSVGLAFAKRKVPLLSIGVVVCGFLALWLSQPVNLVKNPSFDDGETHWERVMQAGRPDGIIRLDPNVRRAGAASMEFLFRGPKAAKTLLARGQVIPVVRGRWYLPSFWAKSESSSETDAVFLTLASDWSYICRPGAGRFDWKEITCPAFNVGAADFVVFQFVAHAPAHIWIADPTLHEFPLSPR